MISNLKKFNKDELILNGIDFNFYKVIHKDTGTLYSARISNRVLSDYYKNEIIGLQNEIGIVPFLNHPSIIKYVTYNSKDFENEHYPTLISEYASQGPLSEIIYENKINLNPTQKLIIIYGVATGMSYLHSHDILHNDIKAFNIWLDDRLFPKITGFCNSEKIGSNEKRSNLIIKGTPAYIAPEIYSEKGACKASDVYSFSLFVYELLSNEKVYQEFEDIKQIKESILEKCYRPKFNSNIDEIYRSLIEKCWSQDPKNRPTFDEIVDELENNEQFITTNINKNEYRKYIQYIKDYKITFEFNQSFDNLINIIQNSEFLNFDVNVIFKGIFETERNNLSIFIYKYLDIVDFVKPPNLKKRIKGSCTVSYAVLNQKTGKLSMIQEINKKNFTDCVNYSLKSYFLIDNYTCINKFEGFFVNDKKFYMLFEYRSKGSLASVLNYNKQENFLNDTQKLIIIYGIASGMEYLHSLDILHRDLSPDNILLDDNLYNYDKYNRTKAIDVYSFAITLNEIITNETPYPGLSELKIVQRVTNNERPELKKDTPECFKQLITSCWSQNPDKRPTFDQIVEILETNPDFITENVDEKKYRQYIKYVKSRGEAPCSFEDDTGTIYQKEEEEQNEISIHVAPINLDQFIKQDQIGRGSFGKVYIVLNKANNVTQACKISISTIDECTNYDRQTIERELNIVSELNFPSIIKFIGYSLTDFKNRSKPTIISEYAHNKSLDIIIDLDRQGLANKWWNDTKKLINIYGIAAGMAYIHSHDILHRDLKPGNIFIDEYLFPKIGDFGLSKKIGKDSNKENIEAKSGELGTRSYMSPEILENMEYTKAGDVYAFAFIAYEILTKKILYENVNCLQFYDMILAGCRPEFTPDIPQCYKELIQNCWCNNPNERYSFDNIVKLLKTNPDFITDTIDKNEFYNYVKFIDGVFAPDESNQEQLLSSTFKKITINTIHDNNPFENDPSLKDKFLNLSEFEKGDIINKESTFKI